MNDHGTHGTLLLAQSRGPTLLVGRPERPVPDSASVVDPLLTVAAGALLVALLVLRVWRRNRRPSGERALEMMGRSLGLSGAERRLIAALGVPQPAALLVSEHAFASAAERWLRSGPSEAQRLALGAIASRLGFAPPGASEEKGASEAPIGARRVGGKAAGLRAVA